MSDPYIGEIKIFAGLFAPRGYAFCDGELLKVAQHKDLFDVIDYTYGGDTRTLFALPDLRGRIPIHAGSAGPTYHRLGHRAGVNTYGLSPDEMPLHSHYFNASSEETEDDGRLVVNGNTVGTTDLSTRIYHDAGVVEAMAEESIGETGGVDSTETAEHENRQPFLAMTFIIALTGLRPVYD